MKKITALTLFLLFIFDFAAANLNGNDLVSNTTQKDPTCATGGECDEAGRTFGVAPRRRMMMMFLPVMFKLGVIMTLLVGLTVLVFKSLSIGVILLIFAFGGLFSKLKADTGHHKHTGGPVHVHVHDYENKHQSWPTGYSSGPPWDRGDESTQWNNYLAKKWNQMLQNQAKPSWFPQEYQQPMARRRFGKKMAI